MRLSTIIRVITALALVLLLGSCLIDGGSSDDTGSLVIALPSVGSSAISSGVDTVRIWLYTPGNLEFGVDGGAARLPGAADNFLEASVTGSSGTITIDGIPAATGYRLVIVLGDKTTDAFIPIDVAQSDPFEITGGRETGLNLTAAVVDGLTTALEGEEIIGAVVGDFDGTGSVFAASTDTVFQNAFAPTPTEYSLSSGVLASASQVLGLSSASFDGEDVVLVNTDYGIFPGLTDVVFSFIPSFAASFADAGIQNIVDSGGFYLSDTAEYVLYYQRLGGLGGGVYDDPLAIVAGDWNDSGTDLEDYVEADESPVRAATTDSSSQAFLASTLGTFAVTDEFFGTDFDVDTILTGEDGSGLTFWGIAYPGSTLPLRITQLGYLEGNIVAGTPRGAFRFAASAIGNTDSNGLVPASAVTQIPAVADQPIFDISINDGYLAIATARELVVIDSETFAEEFSTPLRAVALGAPASIFVVDEGGAPAVYIAGAEGLTRIVE